MPWIAFSNRSDRRLCVVVVLTLAIFAMCAAAAVLCSCTMQNLTRVSSHDFPEPQSCGACHVDIYNEWQASPHARSFSNPRFVAATDDHRFEQCLGCHAPPPAMVTGEPKVARATQRELGVTCVSCHLGHGAMVGPLPPTGMVKPHPIVVDRTPFENGRLCGQCHQGTLAQWNAAPTHESGSDCRQCHMPSVVRKTTQATDSISHVFVAAEKNVPEHRHLFTLTPQDLPEPGFALDVRQTTGTATVLLTNHLPHNLPTGDFGVRIVEITTDGIDTGGIRKPLGHWELTNAANGFLASGQSREWSIAVPAGVKSLRTEVVRHGRDDANRAVLLQKEVAVP